MAVAIQDIPIQAPGLNRDDPVQNSTLEKIKKVVGYILIALGAIAFIAGCVATGGQLFGVALMAETLAGTLVSGGVSALVAGFGLASDNVRVGFALPLIGGLQLRGEFLNPNHQQA